MNKLGYSIQYTDREFTDENSSFVFAKNLSEVADEISKNWISADFSHDGFSRTDYFMSPFPSDDLNNNIYFAAINKREIKPKNFETRIRFVARREKGLVNLADNTFNSQLPFDKKKIVSTFSLPNK